MKLKKLLALLLALVMLLTCLAGCRRDKDDVPADEETEQGEPEEPDISTGLEVEEDGDSLVIEIPEGQEMGGD